MINGDYILVKAPEDYSGYKYRSRYIYKHHLIWWKHTGELPIRNRILVHHKNNNKHDNRFRNLERISLGKHNFNHHKLSDIQIKCDYCGMQFLISLCHFRYRQKINKYGVFCSRSCGAKKEFEIIKSKI